MKPRRLARALAAALLATTAVTAASRAAVYIPTKTADTADGACDADCSLREAVLAANAGAGEDVILLHTGTYALALAGSEDLAAAGDLDLTDDLVILGDGAARTIVDGGVVDRLLQVPEGVIVEIRDLTLRNGRAPGAGGAIQNAGQLTILRSVLSGNSSVVGPAGLGFGGAISTGGNDSALTIIDSTIANNTSQGGGGAIVVGGEMTLANVTVAGNRSVADHGGGLYVFSDSRVTVNNATITGNAAALKGGGIVAWSSAFLGFAPKVINSIIAGNTAGADPDCSGDFDSGYDLIGIGTGCHGPAAAKNDQVGTAAAPLDPKLGPTAENGGPTPTRALLAGSPAIEGGSPAAPGSGGDACKATDQRGAGRPGGPRCDIGAFEVTTACVAGGSTLCLNKGRFKVTARFGASSAAAQGVTLTADSGYFWFFGPGNVEVTVKLLDACTANNNRYWFFASGMTNVKVDLVVTDTKTGTTKTYTNPQGRVFRSILDTSAFATCP